MIPADSRPTGPDTRRPGGVLVRWMLFLAIGLVLYGALYVWSERLVHLHGQANRFFQIAGAPARHHHNGNLGASHAMPLGYGDTRALLEAESGASLINLSVEGGGVLPADLLLDYYLSGHTADRVVLFLDSFTFYSDQWNEVRLADPDLFRRAPLDQALAAALFRSPAARPMLPWYLSGFHKINNKKRYAPDVAEAEARFDRAYRPNPQIDRRRVEYLYPGQPDAAVLARYLDALGGLIARAQSAGARVILLKPPVPDRYRALLPYEDAFDEAVASFLAGRDVEVRDLSRAVPGDEFYYDSDHLNRAGMAAFAAAGLVAVLAGK
ncbi:MAG: hypothetical protein KJZ85_04510 [Rhodobacteraceae bacterium]|nr:hypothetical protein [Paracoccaceae bacterium]